MQDLKTEILNKVYDHISNGVKNRKNNFHQMQIASISLDGKPKTRTVVNRGFDKENHKIYFHTDIRSPKVKELEKNSEIEILLYDSYAKLQVRISAIAKIHHKNDLARERWDNTRIFSRECYLLPNAPGKTVDEHNEWNFSEEDLKSDKGFEIFTIVECSFNEIDALFLHHKGHKRYKFTFGVENNISFDLIAP